VAVIIDEYDGPLLDVIHDDDPTIGLKPEHPLFLSV